VKKLYKLIAGKPLFSRVLIALFISGLGTSFTSVAVYGELSRRGFGPFGFALAFAAGLLPGLFTSLWMGPRAFRLPIGRILVGSQLVGLIALLMPLLGSVTGQIGWLLMAEVAASAIGGLLIPVYKTLERESFQESELGSLATLDTFLLTANFIFGQGLGALLAPHLSLPRFLLVDASSYLLSLVLLWPLLKVPVRREVWTRSEKAELTRDQKGALWLLPWLAFVCAPLMVLFPVRGSEFGQIVRIFGLFEISPTLFLICARTVGQLLGPVLAAWLGLSALSRKPGGLSLAIAAYILLYVAAYRISSLYLAAMFCVLAHVASNAVYSIGNFELLRAFPAERVGWASGFVHRAVTLAVALSGLLGGVAAQAYGWNLALGLSSVLWLLGSVAFVIQAPGRGSYVRA
jgi:hypothetical protein